MLKPALSRGEIQTIGATTLDEYRKYIEKDGALERRFQPVIVKAPSVPEAIEIIRGLRHKYEAHHRVKITDSAITRRREPRRSLHHRPPAPGQGHRRHRRGLVAHAPHGPDAAARDQGDREGAERVVREKDMYLEAQEFEKAASLREKEKAPPRPGREMKREWRSGRGKARQTVGEEDIEYIVSRWTGIPLSKLEEKESRSWPAGRPLTGRIVGRA
jgi:ATP-dependent Clp protease ATP-binding subunit ClpC